MDSIQQPVGPEEAGTFFIWLEEEEHFWKWVSLGTAKAPSRVCYGELAVRNPTAGVCYSGIEFDAIDRDRPKGGVCKCTWYITFFQVLRIPKVAVDSIVQSKTVSIKIFLLCGEGVFFIVLWDSTCHMYELCKCFIKPWNVTAWRDSGNENKHV